MYRVCMYFTVIALSLSFSPSLLPSQMFMAFTHMVLRTKKQSQSRAEREREREKETVDINSHRHRERRKRGKKCCWEGEKGRRFSKNRTDQWRVERLKSVCTHGERARTLHVDIALRQDYERVRTENHCYVPNFYPSSYFLWMHINVILSLKGKLDPHCVKLSLKPLI